MNQNEAKTWEEDFSLIAEGLLPVRPSPALKRRLLQSVAKEGRFAPLLSRLAALIDHSLDATRALLAGMEAAWEAGPYPGISFLHIATTPATVGADVGLVKVQAGGLFPTHHHIGEEQVLVLQGGFRDEDGSVYEAGDRALGAAGTSHSFRALPGEDLIYAVVVFGVVLPPI